jgi:hypothetical protein
MANLTPTTQQQLLAPIIVGQAILGAQTAAIGSTVIVPNAPAGLYRFNMVIVITTLGLSTLTANAICTDAAKAETVAVLNGVSVIATGTFQGSALVENIAAANLSYSVTLGGSGSTWNLYIIVERLF